MKRSKPTHVSPANSVSMAASCIKAFVHLSHAPWVSRLVRTGLTMPQEGAERVVPWQDRVSKLNLCNVDHFLFFHLRANRPRAGRGPKAWTGDNPGSCQG